MNVTISLQKAQSLPKLVLNNCMLGPEWARIKEFMECRKKAKLQTCMALDTKMKLEKNFGPLNKLRSQTGLSEKQLLGMALKLIHGHMDME